MGSFARSRFSTVCSAMGIQKRLVRNFGGGFGPLAFVLPRAFIKGSCAISVGALGLSLLFVLPRAFIKGSCTISVGGGLWVSRFRSATGIQKRLVNNFGGGLWAPRLCSAAGIQKRLVRNFGGGLCVSRFRSATDTQKRFVSNFGGRGLWISRFSFCHGQSVEARA